MSLFLILAADSTGHFGLDFRGRLPSSDQVKEEYQLPSMPAHKRKYHGSQGAYSHAYEFASVEEYSVFSCRSMLASPSPKYYSMHPTGFFLHVPDDEPGEGHHGIHGSAHSVPGFGTPFGIRTLPGPGSSVVKMAASRG